MVDHVRHHKVPSTVKMPGTSPDGGLGVHTEEIMDGMDKIRAVAALVESVIVWRAQHIAWNVDIYKAEPLLFRLIFKEGSQNPQAMDLLARIYFQQSKYEKAKDLWNRASELQEGNPALRRTAQAMNGIAKSPSSAILSHRIGVLMRGALLVCLLCVAGWGGVRGVESLTKWADGPNVAVQNLTGRFHYEYDSVTRNMVYVPATETVESTGEIVPTAPPSVEGSESYNIGFTRKKAENGRDLGRIEVAVERVGSTIRASGRIPNLYVRYLVEQSLWDIPGITDVDLRGLVVDRSYRVNRGDSLWLIAKKVYGQGASWTLLAKENNLDNPNRLKIGQELSLPLGDEVLVHS
ncbi:MAG: LysM peptidoglycan-binding domain-containing protein, partial [Synergistaceae bacterium]|nr:LysM peptidoglycan-binding domain-containing protein [Synergistaceae bacterium]